MNSFNNTLVKAITLITMDLITEFTAVTGYRDEITLMFNTV
jgi:hypothetical protein